LESEPRIILATSTNEGYMPRAVTYLHTLHKHSNVENHCLTLDFDIRTDLRAEYYRVEFSRVNSEDLPLPLNNFCVQDGQFLPYLPGDPDDVILFTDADLRMQRPFNDAELVTLRCLKPGQVMVGYNAGPKDTLQDEAHRLGIKTSLYELYCSFGNLGSPCFNWGCVAATRGTWEPICEDYCAGFHVADHHLSHVAKQQWLLSWITSRFCAHVEMPTSFHAHKHYGTPAGCEFRDGLVYAPVIRNDGLDNGLELALFAHKWDRD
jgi:hypothetical protein